MNEKDKAMLNGLIKLINEADFVLKAREVRAFFEIVNWVTDLEKNFVRKPEENKTKSKGISK